MGNSNVRRGPEKPEREKLGYREGMTYGLEIAERAYLNGEDQLKELKAIRKTLNTIARLMISQRPADQQETWLADLPFPVEPELGAEPEEHAA